MRTLAIGDIHGCLGALDTLLAAVAPRTGDTLVFLGDYIDRGPNSAGVLNRLITLRKKFGAIAILGNHEQMILGSRTNQLLHREWIANGGDMTLRSYGNINCTLRDVPPEHWEFLLSLPLYYETATHLFVHAGVQPNLPMKDQPEYTLLWERFHDSHPPAPHISGKTVVCGHTPGKLVRTAGHAICLDTGAFKHDGYLTCLEVAGGYLYHANEKGKIRATHLRDLQSH
jgi:serine/threonine protein phosphatase 1